MPLVGSRRFSVVYSAYHEITTLAPFVCPGIVSEVFVLAEFTCCVDKFVELPPLIVYEV